MWEELGMLSLLLFVPFSELPVQNWLMVCLDRLRRFNFQYLPVPQWNYRYNLLIRDPKSFCNDLVLSSHLITTLIVTTSPYPPRHSNQDDPITLSGDGSSTDDSSRTPSPSPTADTATAPLISPPKAQTKNLSSPRVYTLREFSSYSF